MAESALKNSVLLRMFIIAVLTVALLIPVVKVQLLVSERESRRCSAVAEVSEKWGQNQTLIGPILSVPFQKSMKDDKGRVYQVMEYAHFLPERLSVRAELTPQVRYRGIYEVVLYTAHIALDGEFAAPNVEDLNIPSDGLLWKEASLVLGMSDLKGIREVSKARWNDAALVANPGVKTTDVADVGLTLKPPVDSLQKGSRFSLEMDLNGSSQFKVVPLGKETAVCVSSAWADPSFIGCFLPEKRTVRQDGFQAEWSVLHLNRNFPQEWVGNRYSVRESSFGVELFLPVNQYHMTLRTLKYAFMFIVLTFLAFFMAEVLGKTVLHPIQYALVGLALTLFYVLLLSLSEHMSFNAGYLTSAVATIAVIAMYTRSVSASGKMALLIALILIVLYAFLFMVLQMEEYALLLGSVGLFVILALVMYLTRKVDWYAIGTSASEQK